MTNGVLELPIQETPISIIDLETTGLVPGFDRVIEISIVRKEPGKKPMLIFDTLIDPRRKVSGTEIHGITDADVANAPLFESVAGELLNCLSGSVVAAYNVYFDMKFLVYELDYVMNKCGLSLGQESGSENEPPHFCLMYMRPMLGLGPKCRLEEACNTYGVEFAKSHIASDDALAAGGLLEYYLDVLCDRNIKTYRDLAKLKSYKFIKSFSNSPFSKMLNYDLDHSDQLYSRREFTSGLPVKAEEQALCSYWDALVTAVEDFEITSDELQYMTSLQERFKLPTEQIKALHARIFSYAITQYACDKWIDNEESQKLHRLHKCLSQLGWAPGE